jgi:hypothetical protein
MTPSHPACLLYQLSCCGSKYVLKEREFVAVCYQMTLVRYASLDIRSTLAREAEVLAAQMPETLPLPRQCDTTALKQCTIPFTTTNAAISTPKKHRKS